LADKNGHSTSMKSAATVVSKVFFAV